MGKFDEGGPQGIALAFEPKEKDAMQRNLEHLKTPLLTRRMKTIIFGFGIITDFFIVALFLWFFKKAFRFRKSERLFSPLCR